VEATARMEARISDRLRSISAWRTKLVELLQKYLSSVHWHNPVLVHVLLISTTLVIICSIYAHARAVTLFSFHPVFMTIGSILFAGEGIIAYRNGVLLDTFSPIMQHNKITKVRAIHQSCQILGASFLFLGLMFIFANKVEFNQLLIPNSVHSITGSILILLIVAQVISGDQKLNSYLRSNMTIRRWHGDFGLLIYDLMCITCILGMYEYLQASIMLFLNSLMILVTWFVIQLQQLRKSITGGEGIQREGSTMADSVPLQQSEDIPIDAEEFQP